MPKPNQNPYLVSFSTAAPQLGRRGLKCAASCRWTSSRSTQSPEFERFCLYGRPRRHAPQLASVRRRGTVPLGRSAVRHAGTYPRSHCDKLYCGIAVHDAFSVPGSQLGQCAVRADTRRSTKHSNSCEIPMQQRALNTRTSMDLVLVGRRAYVWIVMFLL
jgi:hypothetical protein